MMRLARSIADNKRSNSLAAKLRRRRFALLESMMRGLSRPIRILDVGGTEEYWRTMGFHGVAEIQVTILNLQAQDATILGFRCVEGDARQMPQFRDKEFHIAFSNSVIEHVGGLADQARMAQEVRRVARHYYVQTPNRRFPIEPHFLFPFFQALPVGTRVWLLTHMRLGWHEKSPDREEAWRVVTGVRLLTKTEMIELFPEALLYEERFLGLVKSFVAYTPTGVP